MPLSLSVCAHAFTKSRSKGLWIVWYSTAMQINFITTNNFKYQIAESFFGTLGKEFRLVQHAIDTPEIQADSVEEIASQSALWVARATGESSVKMDVGFYIEALNGFPGPFVKYINEWLSQEDIITLMQGKNNRNAYFKDALAIAYPDGTTKVFLSKTNGTIAGTVDPDNTKWTMNSLFIPHGHSQTLGSMSDHEQAAFWNNGSTWVQLTEFLSATKD